MKTFNITYEQNGNSFAVFEDNRLYEHETYNSLEEYYGKRNS